MFKPLLVFDCDGVLSATCGTSLRRTQNPSKALYPQTKSLIEYLIRNGYKVGIATHGVGNSVVLTELGILRGSICQRYGGDDNNRVLRLAKIPCGPHSIGSICDISYYHSGSSKDEHIEHICKYYNVADKRQVILFDDRQEVLSKTADVMGVLVDPATGVTLNQIQESLIQYHEQRGPLYSC